MLSPQADAVTAEPDGRSAPEVSLDARVRRCRVGTTGNRRQFRRHTGLMVPFGDGHQGHSTPKSTPAGFLSGESRINKRLNSTPQNATQSHAAFSEEVETVLDWRPFFGKPEFPSFRTP